MIGSPKVFAGAVVGLGVVIGIIAVILSEIFKDSNKIPTQPISSKEWPLKKKKKIGEPSASSAYDEICSKDGLSVIKRSFTPDENSAKCDLINKADSDEEEEFFDACSVLGEGTSIMDLPQELQDDPSLKALAERVDELDKKSPSDQIQAHALLESNKLQFEDRSEFLWRMARSFRNLAVVEERSSNTNMEKKFIFQAHEYAEKALQINARSSIIHKWFGILSGKKGDFLSVRERVMSGRTFKKHIDIAAELNPKDFGVHYLLGRFYYEVSTLPWCVRVIAKSLLGGVPEASVEDSLKHFLESDQLFSWKENRTYIAQCYFKLSQEKQGSEWLQKANDLPVVSIEDEIAAKRLHDLAKKHSVELKR